MTEPTPPPIRPLNEVVAYLDQKHSEDQETIADNLVLALYPLWPIVRFTELDRTSVLWTEAVLPRIETAYMQSQHVAAAFAANVRFASLATEPPAPISVPSVEIPVGVPRERFLLPDFGSDADPIVLDDIDIEDVRLSLLVESNYNIKKQMPTNEDRVMAAARANSTGAAVRQSLKGARNVTNNVVQYDRKVIGFARYTDADPCHFCALLASRGAVYGKRSFATPKEAGFAAPTDPPDVPPEYSRIAKVHNHCRCTLRPVYLKSQELDADAKFYRKQWNDLAENNPGASPDELAVKWREGYRKFDRKPADVTQLRGALRERESALKANGFSDDSPQVRWAQRTQSLLA